MDSLLVVLNGHFMPEGKWIFVIGGFTGFIKKGKGCQRWYNFPINLELHSEDGHQLF